jgi:hypothetical protein
MMADLKLVVGYFVLIASGLMVGWREQERDDSDSRQSFDYCGNHLY